MKEQKRIEQAMEASKIANAKSRLLDEMDTFGPGTPEYANALAQLERIEKMTKPKKGFWDRLDPNTIVLIAGNLGIALVVVAYEQKNVIGSKVRDYLLKTH